MSALVNTEWLEAHLGDPNIRIVEASIAKESFDAAHVPGAVWVDAHRDLSSDESRRFDARLVLLLANHIGDLTILRAAIAAARS